MGPIPVQYLVEGRHQEIAGQRGPHTGDCLAVPVPLEQRAPCTGLMPWGMGGPTAACNAAAEKGSLRARSR